MPLISPLFAHLGRAGSFCIDYRGLRYSGFELDARAHAYAIALQSLGIAVGERVAVLCDAHPLGIAALLGHYRAGCVHVPINTRYGPREIRHILDDADVRVILVDSSQWAKHRELLRQMVDDKLLVSLDPLEDATAPTRIVVSQLHSDPPAPQPPLHDPDALVGLIYTSGTTGKSKGVRVRARQWVDGIGALTQLWEFAPSDRISLSLPLFHVHGLGIGVHGALLHGATLLLHSKFTPQCVVDDFARRSASVFLGVPTMYDSLLRHLEEDPNAAIALQRGRLFASGSAALPGSHFETFRRQTGHEILERYGMSETMLSLSNPYRGQRKRGSVGIRVPGFQARIVDINGQDVERGEIGELEVRGPGVMDSYWKLDSAAEFRDNYFRTGDIASQDDDGYFQLHGRASVDIIKSGGFKIAAREIEELLSTESRFGEIAIVGLPDPRWGQSIALAVGQTEKKWK